MAESTTSAERNFTGRVGIIGLGPIGRNFALNLASRGHGPAVFDRASEPGQTLLAHMQGFQFAEGTAPRLRENTAALMAELRTPRVLFFFVPAGAPTDAALREIAALAAPGDVLIDGGNSFHEDTNRRAKELEQAGLLFLGMGLSGGAEGARKGPSLMPGGSRAAYDAVAPMLLDTAARAHGSPCLAYMGEGGAGHYVKMVHNGLEYADMQLIAEAYHLLRERGGLSDDRQSKLFAQWNTTDLESYLLEITAAVLAKQDGKGNGPILNVILDRAGQKGTGRWTGTSALELAVAAPALSAAVDARVLSSLKDERMAAGKILPGPRETPDVNSADNMLEAAMPGALLAARLCIYAQGMALLARAGNELNYAFELGEIPRIWRAGCIIRSRLLEHIIQAFARTEKDPAADNGLPANLLIHPTIAPMAVAAMPDLRSVLGQAIAGGIPAPVMSACLAYYDAYRTPRLPANLIQAQRDFFGAHGFERTDREGVFHLGD